MRKGLEVTNPSKSQVDFEPLDRTIRKLRLKIQGCLMCEFDRLAGEYDNPVVEVSNGVCMGCLGNVPPHHALRLDHARELLYCEQCGRILFSEQHTPSYIPVK